MKGAGYFYDILCHESGFLCNFAQYMKPTRIILLALFILTLSVGVANAQSGRQQNTHSKELPMLDSLSYCWKLVPPLGLRELAPMDTIPLNYYRQAIPSLASNAWATTGNLGAEGMNMIFYQRAPISDFFFRDGLTHWMPTHDKMLFYNTRIPFTMVDFNTAGGRENAQDRLQMKFSGNINSKAQVGAMLDYLYSKGCYNYQATKDLSWGFNGSYIGDRYELQAYYNHYNLLNKENGGITDMLYITDPAEIQGGVTKVDTKTIPTNLTDAHTRVRGEELYINNRYKVGYWREDSIEGDTSVVETYVPVSSFIYTLKFNSSKHLFIDNSPAETKEFFKNTYLDPNQTHDITTYWALSNTLGVSLLEGFHKYAKFGMAAYITHQVRRYNFTPDTLDRSTLELTPFPEGVGEFEPKTTQQLAWVGAQITKQNGSTLKYEATGQLGILGEAAGDINVKGSATTMFPLFGDSLDIKAFGEFRNEEAPFLTKKYLSNHFIWDNEFGKERTVTFGGEVYLGKTDTRIRASVTNVQNHIYFGDVGPLQHGGSVQVLTVALQQNFKAGPFHWDNSITYQTTSDDAVIPLPKLTVYSNAYLLFRIATLRGQFGVDCDYYTKYYAPAYQPALASFTNQREAKYGNFPFCNVYLNMKLSRCRFYVMYSHFNKGLFGGDNYFSVPYYPLNPSRFQMGISVNFLN